jgi:hypothetical protein
MRNDANQPEAKQQVSERFWGNGKVVLTPPH